MTQPRMEPLNLMEVGDAMVQGSDRLKTKAPFAPSSDRSLPPNRGNSHSHLEPVVLTGARLGGDF
jgi:hypothetical protein